ncbi:MAG: hypothetical protein LBR18_09290 [Tannerella sp.]|nr:hypothetical protein [Tannerella sp.]
MRRKEESGDFAEAEARFDEMYRQFFRRERTYYFDTEKEIIAEDIEDETISERDAIGKIQMLAELLYQDALIRKTAPERIDLLEKALYLFRYLDANSKTFSWERGQRMQDIVKMLDEVEI